MIGSNLVHPRFRQHRYGACLLSSLYVLSAVPAGAAAPAARFDDVPRAPAPAPRTAARPRSSSPATRAEHGRPPSGARLLFERAERHELRGDDSLAARDYSEALRLEPGFGLAYLRLARLRERAGDDDEAERLYGAASRLREVAPEALAARARLRRRTDRAAEAFADLEGALTLSDGDPRLLRELALWYAESKSWPAALGLWRRRLATLERDPVQANGAESSEARLQVQALSLLAGDADPVVAPVGERTRWVRHALRSIGRRAAGTTPR